LLRAVPFRPFGLSLENGDRIVIEHSENIASTPSPTARRAHQTSTSSPAD
jgi:hypothetical protein